MRGGKDSLKDRGGAIKRCRIILGEPIPTEQFQAQVSPELQALLSKMLSKDKAARHQSAQDLLTDLRQVSANLSAAETQADAPRTKEASAIAPKENLSGRMLSKAQRHKWAVLAAALALVLLAVVITRWLSAEHLDTLAILPFSYVSSDPQLMAKPDREYLSDGFTDSIINNLSTLANCNLISISS